MQEMGGYFRKQHPITWFATQSQRLKWPKQNVLTKSAAVNCFFSPTEAFGSFHIKSALSPDCFISYQLFLFPKLILN